MADLSLSHTEGTVSFEYVNKLHENNKNNKKKI